MKDEATTFLVMVLFWTFLAIISMISAIIIAFEHPYLGAAFVTVCVVAYFMSGEKK